MSSQGPATGRQEPSKRPTMCPHGRVFDHCWSCHRRPAPKPPGASLAHTARIIRRPSASSSTNPNGH
jgi:hypothetical protein